MIARDEVEIAAARAYGYIRRTSVMRLEAGVAVWYQGDHRVVIVDPESRASWAPARAACSAAEADVGGIATDSHGASVRFEQ